MRATPQREVQSNYQIAGMTNSMASTVAQGDGRGWLRADLGMSGLRMRHRLRYSVHRKGEDRLWTAEGPTAEARRLVDSEEGPLSFEAGQFKQPYESRIVGIGRAVRGTGRTVCRSRWRAGE